MYTKTIFRARNDSLFVNVTVNGISFQTTLFLRLSVSRIFIVYPCKNLAIIHQLTQILAFLGRLGHIVTCIDIFPAIFNVF